MFRARRQFFHGSFAGRLGRSLVRRRNQEDEDIPLPIDGGLQSRRMQAEYMEASTQVFNQLQKEPSTMNNPAVWLDAYTEEMTSRVAAINNKYDTSFSDGRNQMLSNESLRCV